MLRASANSADVAHFKYLCIRSKDANQSGLKKCWTDFRVAVSDESFTVSQLHRKWGGGGGGIYYLVTGYGPVAWLTEFTRDSAIASDIEIPIFIVNEGAHKTCKPQKNLRVEP
jgi:hypothetical protein